MKSNDIPPWVLHFLIHVVKRCCSTVVKYIELLEKNRVSDIEPWALDILINVVKNCCSIIVKYVEDEQKKEKESKVNK